MLQRYKLRLGDGTVLQVDQDGLRAWQEDAKATVQVAGTQEWRPLREVLADQESAARLARALVRPEPRRAPAPSAPPELPPPGPPPELTIGAPPLVQALADEPAAPQTPAPPWREPPAVAEEAPAIRLKPLDESPPSRRHEIPSAAMPEDDWKATDWEDERERAEKAHDRLEGPLLQVLSTLGNLLSRCLDPLTPLARSSTPPSAQEPPPARPRPVPQAPRRKAAPVAPPPPVSVLAEEPGEAPSGPRSRLDELPVIPLKPLDEGRRLEGAKRWGLSLYQQVVGWLTGLVGWFKSLKGEGRVEPGEPFAPLGEPAPRRPAMPAAREPLAPPVPIEDLPPLPLAEVHEERAEEEDVYEGEEAASILPVLWFWTKRVVLLGALGAGAAYAALRWETWFPRAAELGQTVFTEIDRQARSGERAAAQQQALRDATERLPHLAPETIRLVLATSADGVLEPPEVFQLASEAADRGRSSLAAAEAAELAALRRELVSELRPPERARFAEYERARAQRVVFPFENPYALELVGRGARAMPARSRERLQVLLGKAVAAGLKPSPAPAGSQAR
jgi:hypothetical protein